MPLEDDEMFEIPTAHVDIHFSECSQKLRYSKRELQFLLFILLTLVAGLMSQVSRNVSPKNKVLCCNQKLVEEAKPRHTKSPNPSSPAELPVLTSGQSLRLLLGKQDPEYLSQQSGDDNCQKKSARVENEELTGLQRHGQRERERAEKRPTRAPGSCTARTRTE